MDLLVKLHKATQNTLDVRSCSVLFSAMVAAPPIKVTPKARKGRFSGVAAVAHELGLTRGHVWRVLSGERANYGTAETIRAAYNRWTERNGKVAA